MAKEKYLIRAEKAQLYGKMKMIRHLPERERREAR
jgi:hypothetical protein